MENKLIFAVDVDAVLRDNLGTMLSLYNKEFKDNKKLEDITQYKTDVSFPRIFAETGVTAQHWFFQDHSDELFLHASPYPHVAEDMKRLRKLGTVVIVTYQKTIKNKLQTLEWLEKNGIGYDSILFTKDKSVLKCDYMIDDNDWNFLGSNAKYGYLVNEPYNKYTSEIYLLKNSNCHQIKRCNSFHEFVDEMVVKHSDEIILT